MGESNTSDQILTAAMDLFSEKGFAAVTTKEIAAKAQVSEVTLFRYFETKKALYQKVFKKFVINPSMDEIQNQEVTGDLQTDLKNIALVFQNMIKGNLRLIRINLKDNKDLFDFDGQPVLPDKLVIKKLTPYFTDMKEKGKIIGEPLVLAVDFVLINVSIILFLVYSGDIPEDESNQYVESLINIFTKGITV